MHTSGKRVPCAQNRVNCYMLVNGSVTCLFSYCHLSFNIHCLIKRQGWMDKMISRLTETEKSDLLYATLWQNRSLENFFVFTWLRSSTNVFTLFLCTQQRTGLGTEDRDVGVYIFVLLGLSGECCSPLTWSSIRQDLSIQPPYFCSSPTPKEHLSVALCQAWKLCVNFSSVAP